MTFVNCIRYIFYMTSSLETIRKCNHFIACCLHDNFMRLFHSNEEKLCVMWKREPGMAFATSGLYSWITRASIGGPVYMVYTEPLYTLYTHTKWHHKNSALVYGWSLILINTTKIIIPLVVRFILIIYSVLIQYKKNPKV